VILVTKDEYYLGIALAVAKKSACLKKQHGAVIVKNDEIVSTGYNGNCRGEPHCLTCTKVKINKDEAEYLTCKSVHAEMNAIISASRNEMLGADLYLAGFDVRTGEAVECEAWPCEICLRLIKNAGINNVINNRGIIYMRSEHSNLLLPLIEKEKN
jgi:dCMP deaminase